MLIVNNYFGLKISYLSKRMKCLLLSMVLKVHEQKYGVLLVNNYMELKVHKKKYGMLVNNYMVLKVHT